MGKNKTIILGVTGGIAAYKMANLSHTLCKSGYDVHVVMTQNALNFITPLTFETLTRLPCVVDSFERSASFEVEHISLAKKADLLLIAPATANIIAKLANGIADDALTTQALACTCTKIIAPAMNTAMLQNPATQRNLCTLRDDGYIVISPSEGLLACGDVGAGKLPEEEVIISYIERELAHEKDYSGKNILVTAGATQEALDPVRYITNHSSGKMGYAIAYECMLRGANVTLISAPTNLPPVPFVKTVNICSAQEMLVAVSKLKDEQDIIIKAAAVADYCPESRSDSKIKKSSDTLSLPLVRTTDILGYLGADCKENQFLCGFSMETENLIENSCKKLEKKNLNMIVANNLNVDGAGFGTETNVVTIITKDETIPLPLLSKAEVARVLMDEILTRLG